MSKRQKDSEPGLFCRLPLCAYFFWLFAQVSTSASVARPEKTLPSLMIALGSNFLSGFVVLKALMVISPIADLKILKKRLLIAFQERLITVRILLSS